MLTILMSTLTPLIRNSWPYILAAVIAVGAYFYVYNKGYNAAEAYYEAKSVELIQEALKLSNELNLKIKKQQEEADVLRKQLEESDKEAVKDPNAGRTSLGSSSVRRLNKVQ